MAGSCPLTKVSEGQHDMFFHMEKGDTSAEGRRDLTSLLESKCWSGTAPFSSCPLSCLHEAHILLCRSQGHSASATGCFYCWGSVCGKILTHMTFSNERLLRNTDDVWFLLALFLHLILNWFRTQVEKMSGILKKGKDA